MKYIIWVVLLAVACLIFVGTLDAQIHAIESVHWASVGRFLGTIIVVITKAEIAKLMFWIHLLT